MRNEPISSMPAVRNISEVKAEAAEAISADEVKKFIAPNASEKELFLFMGLCRTYGLNPLKKEIYFVKYGQSPGSIVVGYETYIKRAERSGRLDGWGVELGKDSLGEKATITIHRKDLSHPFTWTVYRKEFDSGKANWAKMPLFMLRKVAISQGFRLAFSEELGGMPYIPEEINGTVSEDLKNVSEENIPEEKIDEDTAYETATLAMDQCTTVDELRALWAAESGWKRHSRGDELRAMCTAKSTAMSATCTESATEQGAA